MSESLHVRLQIPICEVKVACDGNTLFKGRKICGRCEETLAKRAKQKAAQEQKAEPVLRGEVHRTYTRKKKTVE